MALDVVGIDLEEGLHQAWRARIERVAQLLGWPVPRFAQRRDGRVVTLTFTVPCNQLHTAREANEWALCAALIERDPSHWSSLQESLRAAVTAAAADDPARACVATEIEEAPALQRLQRIGAAEARAGGCD
ncbi:MAG TPA: hypothetical protein VF851_01685 [Steroidobacteraceae bacterium]